MKGFCPGCPPSGTARAVAWRMRPALAGTRRRSSLASPHLRGTQAAYEQITRDGRACEQPFTHRRVEHTGGAAPAWHCSGLRQLARKGRARVRRAPPMCAGKQQRAVKGRRSTEEEATRTAVKNMHARASGSRCAHRRQGPTGQSAPGSVAYRDANGRSRPLSRAAFSAVPTGPRARAGDPRSSIVAGGR